MAPTKNVFIGSLFEFTSVGADEILDGLREQFVDPESVPFISYDRNTRLFSCHVDANDHNTISLLSAQVDAYTALHHRKVDGLFDSDKLVPIEGTILHDEIHTSRVRDQEQGQLLDFNISSDEDDAELSQEHETVYWKPKCDDITILTTETAHEVAEITNTWLIPSPLEHKVEIRHGNVKLAFEKLQRLEDVLTRSAPHRSRAASRIDANIYLLSTKPGSTLKFVRPVQPLCGFDRVFLDPAQMHLFSRIMICEVRIWESTKRIKPVNLDLEGVSLTAKHGTASVFENSRITALGDAKNAEPRPPSKENSQASDEPQRPGSPTKYLGQKDAERVEEWRGNVDQNAAPTLPPEEPVADEQKDLGRRRVIQDSDDEDSDDGKEQVREIRSEPNKQPEPVQAKETQGPAKSALATIPTQTNNVYDLLSVDEVVDQHTSSSEDHVSEVPKGKTEQLNVTFQEPKSWNGSSSVVTKVSISRKQEDQKASNFDGSQYGLDKHLTKSGSNRPRKQDSHIHENSVGVSSNPVPYLPRPPKSSSHQRQGHLSAGSHQLSTQIVENLIDAAADEHHSDEYIMPPPGFDYRSPGVADDFNSPSEAYQQTPPSSHKRTATLLDTYGASSATTSGSSDPRLCPADFKPQFTAPKRNITFMQEQTVSRLKAQIEANSRRNTGNNKNKSPLPPNRIQKDDELRSRKYHNTMSQKMAKPIKSKKNALKHETKAERETRIAKVKADAYGDTNSAKAGPPKSQSQSQSQAGTSAGDMTAKKRQILKNNSAMAELHQEAVVDIANKEAALKLAEELKPILQATRAFKGIIKVELQLGQALVLNNNRLSEASVYSPKDWMQLLNGKMETDPKVIFTNILTSNGQDIDRMLEIKADTQSGKLWNKSDPGITSVTFEFSCQDKSGRDFLLVLDQDGSYSLQRIATSIGKIALHAPAQIWDACAVVSGTMRLLRPADDILAGAEQFKESLYIPGGSKVAIYYRLPPNNAFSVKDVVMRRVSTHDCLLKDREEIQLRVTEVKALSHSSHPTDKKLYRSYESNYEVMINENRLHYEVAIVDKSVEKMFEANPDIEIGELAPVTSSNSTSFSTANAYGLVEVTSYMLERIDWAGGHNVGTLRRIHETAADQRASLANTLPQGLKQNLPIPMGKTAPTTVAPTTYQSHHSRVGSGAGTAPGNTTAGANTLTDQIMHQLHGIRAHTAAELYQDNTSGEYFYYGQGGARIPVISEQLEGLKFDGRGPVFPGDSASQIGDSKKKMAGPGGSAGRKAGFDDKPAGFW